MQVVSAAVHHFMSRKASCYEVDVTHISEFPQRSGGEVYPVQIIWRPEASHEWHMHLDPGAEWP